MPTIDYALCIISKHILTISLIDVSKILTLVNFSRSKSKVKVIFGAAFHKLKYESSLKSVTIR